MSASEKRLRRRRKVEKIFTSDYIESDDQLHYGGKIPTNDDFQSASLSSDNGEHITKDKPKRRVLRRTNDFQNLKPSTQLDDKDSNITSTKVKRSKKTTHLPQICDIEEEYEILQTKMKNRKRHKQNTSGTVIKEDMSSTTSKTDTDTSVPSESQLPSGDLGHKQKTKRKNQRRRNRRHKKIQFSSAICNSENESSVDTCASDVASKPSNLLDSKEMGNGPLDGKSTSDSDSIVYSFRNRKRAALAESTVQNIVPSKATSDKSDDSVEYNYKRKRGKTIQKFTELEDGKELALELSYKATETGQQKHLAQSQVEPAVSTVTKILEETFGSKSAYQSGMIDSQMKKTRKSIMKSSSTLNNGAGTETMVVTSKTSKNEKRAVQFQQDELLNTPCEDLNEKNNTYELDKSKNDISVLKTVQVESTKCFKDSTSELKASTNLKHRETELQKPSNAKHSNKANPSKRRTFELETVTDLNVLTSGKNTSLNDNVDSTPEENVKLLNESNPSSRRTFDLEESSTDLIVLKLASVENVMLKDNGGSNVKENFSNSDGQVKPKKSTSGSNTPFSRVTRRNKVRPETNGVNIIDDISPPQTSLPSTTDDSSSEEPVNYNKSITKNLVETISSFSKRDSSLSQSDQNLSSLGVSSTPLPKREGTYTLLNTRSTNKKMHSTGGETVVLVGPSSTNKPSTRRKMPNFALIHKKAFEKMEDIGQLHQRKAERAKLLLSGVKPELGLKLQSPRKIQNQKILKPLNFGIESFKYSGVNELPKPLCNVVLQNAYINSPKLLRTIHQPVKHSGVNESPKLLHNSQNILLNSPKALRSNGPVFVNSPKVPKSRVQSPKFVNSPKVAKCNLQSPKVKINTALKLNQDTKEKPNKLKPTILGKHMNSYGASMKIHKPVIQENGAKRNIQTLPSTGITRYGFKAASNLAKTITKQEQLKAVANKNNIVRNNVDERRNDIKGVRSNRRFELLMKMRNKSKSANAI